MKNKKYVKFAKLNTYLSEHAYFNAFYSILISASQCLFNWGFEAQKISI